MITKAENNKQKLNRQICQLMGLCYHEWKGTPNHYVDFCTKCKKDKYEVGENKDFLAFSDSQFLLDWCRKNIEKECLTNCEVCDEFSVPAKCTGKISNLSTILKIIEMLWEGAECSCMGNKRTGFCVRCVDTKGRVSNRPLAWAILGEVILPKYFPNKLIDPLTFCKTLRESAQKGHK